jgi:DNA-binding transcriptional regulator YdaS (Cro superfamily)
MNAIERAIRAVGGRRALAERVGVRVQAVEKWVRFERIPAERVLTVEELTGVSRHDLRPDLYPRESTAV